jgi:CxC2 like cysteine cluster associated with KDZ transposases
MICQKCFKTQGAYRCQDCFWEPFLCLGCCLEVHQLLPFHKLSRWDGRCFVSTTLKDLGYSLHLGHGGLKCPQFNDSNEEWVEEENFFKSSTLTVVDTTGIHQLSVHWCSCPNTSSPDQQLLHAELFSASYKMPKTAFTFKVLNHFHLDSMECKTSAQNFYSKLRRLTNNVFPDLVPVSMI